MGLLWSQCESGQHPDTTQYQIACVHLHHKLPPPLFDGWLQSDSFQLP